MEKRLSVLDTTLRDGAQSAQVNYSLSDKIKIIKILAGLGIEFAEIGSPAISSLDAELFKALKSRDKLDINIVAFAPTVKSGDIEGILEKTAELSFEYVSLFGKSCIQQVENVLLVSPDENLKMIEFSVGYLVSKGKKVIFEAEHFFDGWFNDREYAERVLNTAVNAGAARIVLCDTNGGMLPDDIENAVSSVYNTFDLPVGIHCHNDSGLAVANTMAACKAGVRDIHGTFCGLGERCGNANLCTVIPNLQIKMGYTVLNDKNLSKLTGASRKIADIANIPFPEREPYVGRYAFSHKAGTHIDAVLKYPYAFHHIDPEKVGNHSELLVSNQSGRAAAAEKFKLLGISVEKNSNEVSKLLQLIKEYESEGYRLENADGTVSLLALQALGKRKQFFELLDFKIVLASPIKKESPSSVLLKLSVNGESTIVADEGIGPVNAIDKALRKGLGQFYPELAEMKLSDYRVRVIDSKSATAARVIVSIDSHDGKRSWHTTGVSTDIIEASWNALCQSIEYKLSCECGLI